MSTTRLPIIFLAMLLLATPVYAEDGSGFSIGLGNSYTGEADIEDDRGGYSLFSTELAAQYLFLSAGYERSDYSWNDRSRLPFATGSTPWDTLHSLELGANWKDGISGNWGYFAHGGMDAAFEKEMSDSMGATLLGGATYALGEGWEIRAGLGGRVHPLKNSLFPVIGLSWEDTSNDGLKRFFSMGFMEMEAGYALSEQFMIRGAFCNEGGTYRLADDSEVAREGYAEMSGNHLGLYLDWTPISDLMFTVGAEYRLERTITTYNSDGDKIDEYEVDEAPAVTASMNWSF